MAQEIIMSMPSLHTSGGIFLLYPAMRAAKVTTTQNKQYIMSMLRKVALEVPVADLLAEHIKEFERHLPTEEQCREVQYLYGENWDVSGNFIGTV
jgi:hypothetical protein